MHVTSLTVRFVAPTRYLSGPNALAAIGDEVARFGGSTVIVHGDVGWPLVSGEILAACAQANIGTHTVQHRGYVTAEAVDRLSAAVIASDAKSVLVVGGGRVLDAGKAAADATGLPCVLVPTSPATCSGTTAVIVDYDGAGAYLGSRRTYVPPATTVVDTLLLAKAPNRLLVAGLVDAFAKAVEVLSRSVMVGGGASCAAYALSATLEERILNDAVDMAAANPADPLRQEAAEISLLWPGLIGGLASEAAKLAAAHAVHNALTHEERDSRVEKALHGEILAFGILVQTALQQDFRRLTRYAALFEALECPATLQALGFKSVAENSGILQRTALRTLANPSMAAAFPDVDAAMLSQAFLRADAAARDPYL